MSPNIAQGWPPYEVVSQLLHDEILARNTHLFSSRSVVANMNKDARQHSKNTNGRRKSVASASRPRSGELEYHTDPLAIDTYITAHKVSWYIRYTESKATHEAHEQNLPHSPRKNGMDSPFLGVNERFRVAAAFAVKSLYVLARRQRNTGERLTQTALPQL